MRAGGKSISEEAIVSKVGELMETLYVVKRYSALARSLRKFTTILALSFLMLIILGMTAEFLGQKGLLNGTLTLTVLAVLVLIPVVGIISGILFVRRRINSVKPTDWKEQLSDGFPSALKILLELDWEKTFEEIAIGKLGYVVYVVLKTATFWVITFFAMQLAANAILVLFNQGTMVFTGYLFTFLSFIIVFLVLGNDLVKRYKEIQALDLLLWELRWFSTDVRKVEFET